MHTLLICLAALGADAQPAEAAPTAQSAPAWPGFLGAGASTLQPDALPLEWSPQTQIAWKADTPGFGQSSPVVWGERVYLTAVEGPMKDTLHVCALSLAEGKLLWNHAQPTSEKVESSDYVSRAAPTPVVDGERVYAFFESGDLVALTHDGQPAWKRSLSQDYGPIDSRHGLAASPVQTADAVIVLVDHDGPSYLLAVRKSDGKTLWKTDRASRVSWSSPALAPAGDGEQVVCSSSGSVDGYDPATGKLLWSLTDVGGNTVSTPMPIGPATFLIGASPGEGGERADVARKSNGLVSVETADGQFKPIISWLAEGAMPSFGSPMVQRGCAYWVNRTGVVFCFDVATGKELFAERTAGSCWATPLGVGDRVYFFHKNGATTVLAAGPEFKKLAENQLWDDDSLPPAGPHSPPPPGDERGPPSAGRGGPPMFGGPVQYGVAAVNGTLLIRSGTRLYCLRP